jgi:hypothetical protein
MKPGPAEAVKAYLAAVAIVVMGAALWFSGRHFGRTEYQEQMRFQDAANMAACRDAWERWGQ